MTDLWALLLSPFEDKSAPKGAKTAAAALAVAAAAAAAVLLLQLHRLLLWLSSASLLNPATTPLGG